MTEVLQVIVPILGIVMIATIVLSIVIGKGGKK